MGTNVSLKLFAKKPLTLNQGISIVLIYRIKISESWIIHTQNLAVLIAIHFLSFGESK